MSSMLNAASERNRAHCVHGGKDTTFLQTFIPCSSIIINRRTFSKSDCAGQHRRLVHIGGRKALQHIRIITDTCKTLKSWEHTSLIFIDLHWIQKQDEIRQSSRTIHCHTMPTTIHNVNITCDLSHGYCWAMAGFIAWGFVTAWQGRTAAQLKSHHLSATIRLSATVLAHLGSLLWSTRLVHPFAASQVNDIVGMGRDEWELTIF